MKSSTRIGWVLAVFTLATSVSTSVLAADVATGMSESQSASILDSLYVNVFSTFHGPSVMDLGSPYSVNNKGISNTPKPWSKNGIYFDSELTTAYMASSSLGIGPVVPFLYSPVMGQDFTLGDVGIKAFDKKAISTPQFTLYTNLILQAPTSTYSSGRNMTLGVKTTPNFRYTLAKSRFSVGAWTEAKAYLGGITSDQNFKLYAAPYMNYQLSRSISLNLEYEVDSRHAAVGDTGFSLYQSDWQPGFVWAITHGVIVNPYLQVFTTNTASMDHSALGCVISATIL